MPARDPHGKEAIITGDGSGRYIIISQYRIPLIHHQASVCLLQRHYTTTAAPFSRSTLASTPRPENGSKVYRKPTLPESTMLEYDVKEPDFTDWKRLESALVAFDKELGGTPDIVVPGVSSGTIDLLRLKVRVAIKLVKVLKDDAEYNEMLLAKPRLYSMTRILNV